MFLENQERMIGLLEDIHKMLSRVSCQFDMRKKIQIDEYFPVKNLNQIKRFLDRSDGQFDLRREEFENSLYTTVTTTLKLKRPFESTLLASLFSRDFLSSHKWPGPR